MKVALCQVNQVVGDFAGNVARILARAREAAELRADLAVFPELALTGYPPMDLLNVPTFADAAERALAQLAAEVPRHLPVAVGSIARNPDAKELGGRPFFNAAWLLEGGKATLAARKCLLPTYDVFDEHRWFEPADRPELGVRTVAGSKIGFTICEDIWNDKTYWESRLYRLDPVEEQVRAGAEVLVNLSASPWCRGKETARHRMLQSCARRHGRPVVFVNMVGGNVSLLFDGSSTAVGPEGAASATVMFAEAVRVVDVGGAWTVQPEERDRTVVTRAALVMGLRDYFGKFGFDGAVVGLSGGIDSALVAALAVEALGARRVVGLAMPSVYSSDGSLRDARELAQNLGITLHVVPIQQVFDAYRAALSPVFAGRPEDVTEENLQSRIRGALLMAFSNKFGHIVLATGNKSECSVGYTTLYGDTCGGLAVIADLWKNQVYELARTYNAEGTVIPRSTLEKPPSAELRPGQVDTDSLPPYERLDPILRGLVEDEAAVATVAAKTGESEAMVREIQEKLHRSEYKRHQFPPTLRVSRKAWVGRIYPILHRFRE